MYHIMAQFSAVLPFLCTMYNVHNKMQTRTILLHFSPLCDEGILNNVLCHVPYSYATHFFA